MEPNLWHAEVDYRDAISALNAARSLDQQGQYEEADILTAPVFRLTQTDPTLCRPIPTNTASRQRVAQSLNAVPAPSTHWHAQQIVNQLGIMINQAQSDQVSLNPLQKSALLSALLHARQIAYSMTDAYADQQGQSRHLQERQLAEKYMTPRASVQSASIRRADVQFIRSLQTGIRLIIEFARREFSARNQSQVTQLILALNKAMDIVARRNDFYNPASPPNLEASQGSIGDGDDVINPLRLNRDQEESLERYMTIGIARGEDAILNELRLNGAISEPLKQMIRKFWDMHVGPMVKSQRAGFEGTE